MRRRAKRVGLPREKFVAGPKHSLCCRVHVQHGENKRAGGMLTLALGGQENNHYACVVNQSKLVSAARHHVVTHPHFHACSTRPARNSVKKPARYAAHSLRRVYGHILVLLHVKKEYDVIMSSENLQQHTDVPDHHKRTFFNI